MTNKEIRWKQRFENFKKAFLQLKSAVDRFDELDNLAKEGMIQRFEYTYELAWKTIKDFMEDKGEPEKFQRDILKKAFQLDIIDNGEIWLDILSKRNLMAHTYIETTFKEVSQDIRSKYFPEMEKLVAFFEGEI